MQQCSLKKHFCIWVGWHCFPLFPRVFKLNLNAFTSFMNTFYDGCMQGRTNSLEELLQLYYITLCSKHRQKIMFYLMFPLFGYSTYSLTHFLWVNTSDPTFFIKRDEFMGVLLPLLLLHCRVGSALFSMYKQIYIGSIYSWAAWCCGWFDGFWLVSILDSKV
jgi:hypothetical protein